MSCPDVVEALLRGSFAPGVSVVEWTCPQTGLVYEVTLLQPRNVVAPPGSPQALDDRVAA